MIMTLDGNKVTMWTDSLLAIDIFTFMTCIYAVRKYAIKI